MAMTGVLRPGHAQVRVLELDKAVAFYRDVLGLVETGRDDQGRVYFKCWDERDHNSYILRESDQAGLDFFGFKVLDDKTLDELEKISMIMGFQPAAFLPATFLKPVSVSDLRCLPAMNLSCMRKKRQLEMASL